MSDNAVPVEQITWSSYTVPTDAVEADGTFRWDSTTCVVIDDLLRNAVVGRPAYDVVGVLARTRLAAQTVGPGVQVFVDANGSYSRGQAGRVGRAYDDLGTAWFEEPVSSDDLPALAELRGELAADVAAANTPTTLPTCSGCAALPRWTACSWT